MKKRSKYLVQLNKLKITNNDGHKELQINLSELYEKEFLGIFSEILIISKRDFFELISSDIKKALINDYNEDISNNENYTSLIKSYESKYKKKYDECILEINTFLENYKKSINKENKNNYITNFRKHCLQTEFYAMHKCNTTNNKGYFIPISISENINNSKNLTNKSKEKINNIKYVICMQCKKVYLSKKFLNFCSYCEINYYSKIFDNNEEQNLLPIVWSNNHCEFTINEKIICSKCGSQIYIDIKHNLLKCLKCKIFKSPKDIERVCNICNNKYESKILIYNPFEENVVNDLINEAFRIKKKALPKYQHSCDNKKIKYIDYFHNKNCNGKLYMHKYNKQEIIICEKCRKLYNYENFVWICPYCKETFKPNNKDKKEKVIYLPYDINSMRRNFSSRFFEKYHSINKKKREIEIKDDNFEKVKIFPKNKSINKTSENRNNIIQNEKEIENNNDDIKKKIDFFNFTIKEKDKKELHLIKSQDNLFQNRKDNNEKRIKTEKNNIEIKNRLANNNDKNIISIFWSYKNNNIKTLNNQKIINEKSEKSQETSEKNLDDNQNFNINKAKENINIINHKYNKNLFENKKSKNPIAIHLKDNFIKNNEIKKPSCLLKRRNKLNENDKFNKRENNKKINEESDFKKLKNIKIDTSHNYSPKFQIKNYLIKNSNKNSKFLKTDNNKESKLLAQNKFIKDNKIIENKPKVNPKTEEEKISIISVSKRKNNLVLQTPVQAHSKKISKFEMNNFLYNSEKRNSNNPVDSNYKNINYNITNSLTSRSSIKRANDNKFLFRQKTGNNDISKKERIRENYSPKKMIKLNKPIDIIEPEDIDTNEDFPIDDPYLLSHQDLYEEIQEKLKEIMYKNKLPIFNPDFYKIERKIGEGTHGSIYQVMNTNNGERYAIKKIFSNDIILLKYIKKEFELVYEAVHPNILGIYGIYLKCFGIDTFYLSVLMELGETDWEIEISKRKGENKYYKENELMSIIKQLVSGLVYLQKEKKIAHRDVKPENVIIFKNNIYKLGDFGEAKGTKNADKLSTLRGTDTYMSPILYNGLKMGQEDVIHDLYKSDVFSLGYSILYAVSLNHDIINEIRELEKMEDITKILNKRMKPRYSDAFINLILKMINPEEEKRVDFIALDKLINRYK